MTNTITLEKLINRTYKALGSNSEAINITADDVVIPKINSVIDRICKGNVKDLFTGQVYQCGDLPFLRKKTFYTIIDDAVLTDDVNIGDIVIKFDTTNTPSSGAVLIGGEVIRYTSKISTEIQGLTVTTSHKIGEKVIHLYNLPTDISNPFTVFNQDLSGSEYELKYQDDRYMSSGTSYYSVVQNNSGDRYFLFNGVNASNSKIALYYYVTSAILVNITDICLIPDTYAYEIIPQIVAGEIAYESEEVEDAQTKLRIGYSKLSEMYSYYSKINKPNRDKFRIEQRDFSSIRPSYGIRR